MGREQGRRLAGCRVLVAEDDFMTMTLLEDMLADLGAEMVGSVGASAEIVPAVERLRPDIVTLDVNLGGTPAYEAALALKERGLPFVFVSGYDVLVGCPRELDDVPRVAKPFTLQELADALERALAAEADGG